jgi:uncharacterized protein (DUF1684 family)
VPFPGLPAGRNLARSLIVQLQQHAAYNPSCAYGDEYVCPLAPRENWLDVQIGAGEMVYATGDRFTTGRHTDPGVG